MIVFCVFVAAFDGCVNSVGAVSVVLLDYSGCCDVDSFVLALLIACFWLLIWCFVVCYDWLLIVLGLYGCGLFAAVFLVGWCVWCCGFAFRLLLACWWCWLWGFACCIMGLGWCFLSLLGSLGVLLLCAGLVGLFASCVCLLVSFVRLVCLTCVWVVTYLSLVFVVVVWCGWVV